MEKRKPHYLLAEIKTQMTTVDDMNLTVTARFGIRQAGMAAADALAVVRGLTPANFYKSMTTHHDHTVWQDIYHAIWHGKMLYHYCPEISVLA
jgi:motility quorum-sensing regulator/GCU-specific mRNA interferase toxin